MKTKEEQIEDLKATAAIHLKVADKLQQQIEALEKPKQWEPKYNIYTPSESKAMRIYSRLVAYVREFGGDWEADWEDDKQLKHTVYYGYRSSSWSVDAKRLVRTSGAVYMSQECALGLYAKLNSGEVVL